MSKLTLLKFIFICYIILSFPAYADRIRDLTSIQGIRENQLIGYGLIVGLDGTGDQSSQSPYANQSLNNMLSHLGLSVPLNLSINLKNIAAVIVTAQLPPFSHTGEKIDIIVSSIGNAKSLRGGTLLMTPLRGVDNQIYAIAQGNILVSENNNISRKQNIIRPHEMNSGKINQGATIEREINSNFGTKNTINLQLNEQNFSLAQRISDVINIEYPDTAIPIDAKTVQLNTPANNNVQVHMLSNIQNINVTMPLQEAKVVVNSRTGAVVINPEVQLGSCAVAHGRLSIVINSQKSLDVLDKLKKNQNKLLNNSSEKKEIQFNSLNHEKLNKIIQALNALGAKTEELMSILQLMKSAGCLHAKLEIF